MRKLSMKISEPLKIKLYHYYRRALDLLSNHGWQFFLIIVMVGFLSGYFGDYTNLNGEVGRVVALIINAMKRMKLSVIDICSIASVLFVALTFWTQIYDKRRQAAVHVATWYKEKGLTGEGIVSNGNEFPIYNVIAFVVPNDFSTKSVKKVFRMSLSSASTDDEWKVGIFHDKLSKKMAHVEKQQRKRENKFHGIRYWEVFPPGKSSFLFDNNHSMGNEHKIPGVFFTDNQNVQWLRDIDGNLKRKGYVKCAQKMGLIYKHV